MEMLAMAYILGYRNDGTEHVEHIKFRALLYRWFVAPWHTSEKSKQE